MFDDLFCASALATVGAVLAAGVWISASEFSAESAPAIASNAASADVAVAAAVGARVPPPAAMPVHELPRVVIIGHRSRDGDLVAAQTPLPDGR